MTTELRRTRFKVPKMDCPSEERIIRLALADTAGILSLTFDLPERALSIEHEGSELALLTRLEPLGFGAEVQDSSTIEWADVRHVDASDTTSESAVLKKLLGINASLFVVELLVGWYANSSGLLADSLDMFADAAVYGISLYAVGRSITDQNRAARISGILQIVLAGLALGDVLRRLTAGTEPIAPLMMSMALLALVANATCLALLSKHRDGGVHMRASWIFSGNDVIANTGVIAAGAAVWLVRSSWPDLLVGSIIAVVVCWGGLKILRLTGSSLQNTPRAKFGV